ncbi:MAG: chemotaxis protein CheD [Bacteroidetes bacterium]|nr:chemotaxis protein CheD [Bacteroidota bacterium]
MITTVLGSCVSVCLYDKVRKKGGINHFMLPYWNGQGLASPKYGNIAIEKLIQQMTAIGCNKKDLVAKVFGGANVLNENYSVYNIGRRNVDLAMKMLSAHGIRVESSSVLGFRGRKIIFDTYSGEVLHQFLNKTNGRKENP